MIFSTYKIDIFFRYQHAPKMRVSAMLAKQHKDTAVMTNKLLGAWPIKMGKCDLHFKRKHTVTSKLVVNISMITRLSNIDITLQPPPAEILIKFILKKDFYTSFHILHAQKMFIKLK